MSIPAKKVYPRTGDKQTVYLDAVVKDLSLIHIWTPTGGAATATTTCGGAAPGKRRAAAVRSTMPCTISTCSAG